MNVAPIGLPEPTIRWVDAPTRVVEAAGTHFAYRRLGPGAGVPVILLNHWGRCSTISTRASSMASARIAR